MRRALLAALLLLVACSGDDDGAAPTTQATTTSTTAAEPAEHYPDHAGDQYAGTANWLCHPELADDECDDLDTTVVEADLTESPRRIAPAADPAIDCFYVYPTVSQDPGAIADLDAGDEERSTTRAQFARYAGVCRAFAPVYRQFTLGAIGGTRPEGAEAEIPYGDVLDAWRTYVDELGAGRPVVVIGHSQGSSHLDRLLQEEIAPDPDQRALLVSAILMGSGVGPIDGIPVCEAADDTGCLITFSSYAADSPPTEGALFGRVRGTDEPALCVNPAALAGGDGLADAIGPTFGTLVGGNPDLARFDSAYVDAPSAFRTECAEANGYRYLAVAKADPADPRPLDRFLVQLLGPTWGLHLVDASVVQGDLIQVVTTQAAALE